MDRRLSRWTHGKGPIALRRRVFPHYFFLRISNPTMRIPTLYRTLAVISCALLSACGVSENERVQSSPVEPIAAAKRTQGRGANGASGCVSFEALVDLAEDAFGDGSPNANSVIGKLGKLNDLVQKGKVVPAREQALSIIDFTLRKNAQRELGGTPAQIIAFINGTACFGGLDLEIETLDGTYLINPGDAPQTLLAPDRLGGIALQGDPVSEPTLISISPIPFTPRRPGDGPLTTKLDQYRGFYEFAKASANDLPLKRTAVVEICAPASLDLAIFSRLRLGHDTRAGFQIEPPATSSSFLTCDNAYARADAVKGAPSLFSRVTALFMPKVAFAATANMFYGGGVSGTVTELSPFAPVDPEVSLSGGVSGTVTELNNPIPANEDACTAIEAPIGTGVEAECRPSVAAATFLGTPLIGAPITWTATVGGGRVAPENVARACVPPFNTSIVSQTGTDSKSTVCWTLGNTPGINRLRAVGGVGGDVPAGTYYTDARFFTAAANAPSALRFTTAPAEGANIRAGANIPVTVAVVDKNGVTVAGFSGPVTLIRFNSRNFAGTVVGTVNAVSGIATFTAVSITTVDTGYRFGSTTSYSGTAFSNQGNTFNVIP